MMPAVEEALILVNRIVNKYQTEHDQTRNPVEYLAFPKYKVYSVLDLRYRLSDLRMKMALTAEYSPSLIKLVYITK
jgi:hypothetical protein